MFSATQRGFPRQSTAAKSGKEQDAQLAQVAALDSRFLWRDQKSGKARERREGGEKPQVNYTFTREGGEQSLHRNIALL